MRNALGLALGLMVGLSAAPSFTVDEILSLPTPDNLVASPSGSTFAWTFDERGVRNIYVAEGPDFAPRRLTAYTEDDGQELTQLSFSTDGARLVYVRGGDHGANRPADPPNPADMPVAPKVQIWSVPLAGGAARAIADGDQPAISPDGTRVAFVRDRRIWIAPIDGARAAEAAFFARGGSQSPAWSPDGRTLAFVSNRGDHSFIGLFTPSQPIRFLAPSTSRDSEPVWSRDGRRIAFVRQPGAGGAPRSPLVEPPSTWSLLVATVDSSLADHPTVSAVTALTSGDAQDLILRNPGGLGMQWAADDTLVFRSYRDGWPHLYSLRHPGTGSRPLMLTPGAFMVEQFAISPDGRFIVYNANTGADRADLDRRHLFRVPIDAPSPAALTSGHGIEWGAAVLADGGNIAFLQADAQQPPLPAVVASSGGQVRVLAADHVPSGFPARQLVVPEPVTFRAADGVDVHGQLFKPPVSGSAAVAGTPAARHPAVVYVHGGGPRQMLLGWHYRWEYANDYGINQYLASRGFVVLAVNYRLSVGYGKAVQFPERSGARGASEYRDVLAAGQYLQQRADVDPRRIGVWGASYGGYLTALALGRNSDVFAAGVDVHGVHDRLPAINPTLFAHAIVGDGITEADLRQAMKVEYASSPIAAVGTWRSPVLLIHGDDDRTVDFRQTIDLERRLKDKGVTVEELVLPDDVHDPLLWRNWVTSMSAAGEFFERMLSTPR